MSFQLIAIKILPSCAPGIRKCLEEDRLYSMSKAYAGDKDNPYLLIKKPTRLDRPALQELYNIPRDDNGDLAISVSAIVGKNGDGKSTFLEVNNLCLKDGRPDNDRQLMSFGGNIHDLLRLPFFMSNGTIGDYAQNTINKAIVILKFHEFLSGDFKTAEDFLVQHEDIAPHTAFLPRVDGRLDFKLFLLKYDKQYIYDLISTIDEPIARQSMMRLYDQVFGTEMYKVQRMAYLENELQRLKQQR